ncbi:MAG: M56 family metallopeptidase [Planctomycetota bacterium]|jgi:beta-lactamase regulating signal transducer with metallopeptidase domain
MSFLESTGSGLLVTALGWSLVHFIWQGTLIATLLGAILYGLRRRDANTRYLACCAGMALMTLAPIATFAALLGGQAAPVVPAAPGLLPLEVGASVTWSRLAELLPQLTALWIVGVCLLQLRFLFHWVNAQRIKTRGGHRAPEPCVRCVADLRQRLGIRQTVQIFESGLAAVPMLIGWLRPVILVPTGAVTGLSPQQLRAVLAHELAHVRRHDYLVNVLQAVFESLLFYHPAVWWLSHRLRVEREYCCDDIAVGVGGDALSYAQALSYLDTLRGETYQPALASTGGTLMNRIRRLAGLQTVPSSRVGGWVAPAAASLAVMMTISAVGLARPAEDRKTGPHREHMLAPVHEADVVSTLEALDAREAALIRVLREAGLDDRTLVLVLEAMDADPSVMRAVRGAGGGRRPFLGARLHSLHEEIEADLAAGIITKEQARQRLEHARQEIHEHLEAGRLHRMQRDVGERPGERLLKMQKQVEDDLAAGRITEKQAQARHEEIRARHLKRVQENDGRRHEIAKAIAERLDAIGDEIHRDLDAGVITEEEAKERMHRAMQEIHRRIGERIRGRQFALPPDMREKMQAIHEEVEADLAAGIITKEQARQRLEHARQEIHEHLRSQMPERRGGRPGAKGRHHRGGHEEHQEQD